MELSMNKLDEKFIPKHLFTSEVLFDSLPYISSDVITAVYPFSSIIQLHDHKKCKVL